MERNYTPLTIEEIHRMSFEELHEEYPYRRLMENNNFCIKDYEIFKEALINHGAKLKIAPLVKEKIKAQEQMVFKLDAYNRILRGEENVSLEDIPLWYSRKNIVDEVEFCKDFAMLYGSSSFYKYIDGTIYSPLGALSDEAVLQKIMEEISPYVKVNIYEKSKKILRALKTLTTCNDYPADLDKIHLQNGYYDIKNRCLFSSWEFTKHRLDIEYSRDFDMEPRVWLEFLNDLFEEDDILTLQEYMGYLLIPTKKAQKALFIQGKGGEGKSVITSVIHDIFQKYAVTMKIKDISESEFSCSSLVGKLVAVDDDANTAALKETGLLKNLITDANKILVNPKGKPAFETNIYARFVVMSNTPIQSLYDSSEGFFRRQLVITTKDKKVDRVDDRNLSDKLKNEKQLILKWCIEGLHRLLDNDYNFTVSSKSKMLMEEIREDSFNFATYLKDKEYIDFYPEEDHCGASTAEIYDSYSLWCNNQDIEPVSRKRTVSYMKTLQGKLGIHYTTNIFRKGTRTRGFKNVRIAKSWTEFS